MNLLNNLKEDVFAGSVKATCGIWEREKTVKSENVAELKRRLKAKGQFIVGTSEKGGRTRKVWFSPSVSL